jgi:hypothetical protein
VEQNRKILQVRDTQGWDLQVADKPNRQMLRRVATSKQSSDPDLESSQQNTSAENETTWKRHEPVAAGNISGFTTSPLINGRCEHDSNHRWTGTYASSHAVLKTFHQRFESSTAVMVSLSWRGTTNSMSALHAHTGCIERGSRAACGAWCSFS